MQGECIHLVAVQPVEEGDAYDSGPDARAVRESGEGLGLHLDVLDSGAVQLAQVRHLVVLSVVAEGAVEAALALVKVVGAERLAARDVEVHGLSQLDQVHHQILIELCRVPHSFTKNNLDIENSNWFALERENICNSWRD